MDILIAVFANVAYVWAVINCGLIAFSFINKYIKYKFHIYTITVSAFVMGLGFLSNIWLFLGLISFFKKLVIIVVIFLLILSTIFFRKQYYLLFIAIKNDIKKISNINLFRKIISLILVISILSIAIIYGLSALIMPPSGDSEAFYMVWPKIIAASERIVPQPNYYSFSQIGFSGELHFASLISIANVNAATFFVWFIALAIALIIVQISSELKTCKISKILSIIILITSSTFTFYISGGNVNLFAAAFGLLAYFWTIKFIDPDSSKLLFIVGIFLGFSIIAKFSYLPVIIPGIFILIIFKYIYDKYEKRNKNIQQTLKSIIFAFSILIITLFIIFIPHFIKNYFLFKEPFSPFLYLNKGNSNWLNQVWYTPEITKHIILTYPIALTFGQYPMQEGNISPLIIMFAPLLLLIKLDSKFFSKKNLYLHIGVSAVISVIIWIIFRPSILAPRYILASLLIFIPVIIKIVDNILINYRKKSILKFIIVFSIIIVLALTGLHILKKAEETLVALRTYKSGITGFESVHYDACNFINNNIKSTERIYLAGYSAFYLRPDLLQCIQNPEDEKLIIDEKLDIEKLIIQGFKYIFIQKISHGSLLKNIPDNSVNKIYEDEYSVIYKVIISDKSMPKFIPKQIDPPAWDIVKYNN